MESYILHIYRKDGLPRQDLSRRKTDKCHMTGVLELVASEQRLPFHNAEELWDLLANNNRKKICDAS